jgi:hypothetical protein
VYSPILVQKTHNSSSGLLGVTILIYYARFCDFPSIVFPANGVHPTKASPFHVTLHLSDTLPSIFGDDTLGLIIVRIFADLL